MELSLYWGESGPVAPKHPVRRRNRERALPPHPVVFHPCPVRSAVVPGRRKSRLRLPGVVPAAPCIHAEVGGFGRRAQAIIFLPCSFASIEDIHEPSRGNCRARPCPNLCGQHPARIHSGRRSGDSVGRRGRQIYHPRGGRRMGGGGLRSGRGLPGLQTHADLQPWRPARGPRLQLHGILHRSLPSYGRRGSQISGLAGDDRGRTRSGPETPPGVAAKLPQLFRRHL